MLEKLFTKRNLDVLRLISKENLHLRDIADRLKCSPGNVHKAVQLFKKLGFVKEEKIKNRVFIKLNNNTLLSKVRSLINVYDLFNSINYKKLKKAGTVGVYGSFAQGTDDSKSDIDLWIFTEVKEIDLRDLIRHLEKELGKQVNLLTLNNKKINQLKKRDPEFYIRLKLTSVYEGGDVFD